MLPKHVKIVKVLKSIDSKNPYSDGFMYEIRNRNNDCTIAIGNTKQEAILNFKNKGK